MRNGIVITYGKNFWNVLENKKLVASFLIRNKAVMFAHRHLMERAKGG